jgi:preprotein translocase subunit SecD
MRPRLWITFCFILVLAGFAFYVSLPRTTTLAFLDHRDVALREGLDLKGGASLTYLADTSGIPASQVGQAMQGVQDVIENRVNALGVTEPEIRLTSLSGKPAISIDLPGVTDVANAKSIIGSTAKLEFKDETGTTVLEGTDLAQNGASAQPQQTTSEVSQANDWEVDVTLTSAGTKKFAAATAANVGKQIGIYLDNQLISAPTVNQVISDGQAVITGNFTAAEAKQFALQLNAGALPVPINLVSEESVGASLGGDAVSASLIAGTIGIFLLLAYLIVYYRFPGVLAALAVLLYAALNIALYKLIPVTLTLAGIAGFIISIGIAVDTNILTFERLKEELRLGKPVPLAVQQSFRRAWTSIRDSHLAGLISAIIIFSFGSGSVRGFALVLIIGILLSLFSAITVTRNWMLLVAGSRFHNLLKYV